MMPAMRKANQVNLKLKSDNSPGTCSEGFGVGRKALAPHPIKFQSRYHDYVTGLHKLSYAQAKAAYTCRKCGAWMGCATCLDQITDIVCRVCKDWASNLAESVHGKMK
jgi:hypothetical protein